MGVFRGTIQYTRFFVDGDLSPDWLSESETSLQLRRFVPLHEDGNDIESQGWVLAQSPFDEDAQLLNDRFYFDGRVILSYRFDKIRLPKPYIKELVRKRIDEQRAKLKEEPSRKTCKAIEEAVLYEVRRRVFPKSQIVDLCWDVEKGHLRLFGRGKTLIENFTKLFEQTFPLQLRPRSFADQAMALEMPLRDKGYLESLVPQELFQPVQRTEAF